MGSISPVLNTKTQRRSFAEKWAAFPPVLNTKTPSQRVPPKTLEKNEQHFTLFCTPKFEKSKDLKKLLGKCLTNRMTSKMFGEKFDKSNDFKILWENSDIVLPNASKRPCKKNRKLARTLCVKHYLGAPDQRLRCNPHEKSAIGHHHRNRHNISLQSRCSSKNPS